MHLGRAGASLNLRYPISGQTGVQGSGLGASQPGDALPFPRRLWTGEEGEGGVPGAEKWVPLDHEFDSVKAVRGPSCLATKQLPSPAPP